MFWLLAAHSVIAILLGLAQAPAGPPEHLRVSIFLDFETAPSEESLRIMKNEVNKLVKSSGVSLDWRLLADNRGTEAFGRLVVLKFKGACKATAKPAGPISFGSGAETQVLGLTRVDHGRVIPYSEVECDNVRSALAYVGPGAGQKARLRALGLAMARVVAHELYHVLAGSLGHGEKGLAKASHSLDDLVSEEKLVFSDQDAAAIRRSFTKK